MKISEKARTLLAEEYERHGKYPTYAQQAMTSDAEFTMCSLRAIEWALADAPQPPVGGDMEDPSSTWENSHGPHYEGGIEPPKVETVAVISTVAREHGYYFTPAELKEHNEIYSRPANGYTIELVERAHLTNLQVQLTESLSAWETLHWKCVNQSHQITALQARVAEREAILVSWMRAFDYARTPAIRALVERTVAALAQQVTK